MILQFTASCRFVWTIGDIKSASLLAMAPRPTLWSQRRARPGGSASAVVEDLSEILRRAVGVRPASDGSVCVVRVARRCVGDPPPGDGGPPGGLCGILVVHVEDQFNSGRGVP